MKPTVTVASSSGFKWRLVIAYDGTHYSGFSFLGPTFTNFLHFFLLLLLRFVFLVGIVNVRIFIFLEQNYDWTKTQQSKHFNK